ncbi:MAG: glycosyltransferase family 2 protein [Lachnospiraceae bacterium]|nr:glycosyltransferase family 2 protein [Lachnospiraceae bacterium]
MITIFTPVYNRAHTMNQLYQSLLRQTSFNFEWIIVDDGSTDHTAELVEGWRNIKNPFFIGFLQQDNGGKHRAINKGVQLAKGEAFFIVDSDDYLTDDAIETVEGWWKDIADDDRFAGVSGLRASADMKIVGSPLLFEDYVDAANLDRDQYGLNGDKAEVYKTAILKKYPFPEFEGETFLTENVVWDKIASHGYLIRWYNQVTYICEYREDGLTRAGMEKFYRNPRGWGLYICQSRQLGRCDEKKARQDKLFYFEALRLELSDEDIARNLGIDTSELDHMKRYMVNTLERIGKHIAIYGLGMRGQRLLRLYQGTPITIEYVLDKKIKNAEYLQLDMEEALPKVDAVIVTPRDGQEEIFRILRKRTDSRLIGYEEWQEIAFGERED